MCRKIRAGQEGGPRLITGTAFLQPTISKKSSLLPRRLAPNSMLKVLNAIMGYDEFCRLAGEIAEAPTE